MNEAGNTKDYIDACTKMKNICETKHEYYVSFSYQKNGLIDYISISYVVIPGEDIIPLHRWY